MKIVNTMDTNNLYGWEFKWKDPNEVQLSS